MNHLKYIENKIKTRGEITELLKEWQSKGLKVVFTNGCFDLVHKGHINYLARTASLADKLVIGLNTDASVKRLKGPERPINNQDSRALLLAAFGFVDLVVYFDEETPYELIKEVQPDLLVKGSDYAPENIVGYDVVTEKGGKVVTMDFVEGFSSTNIIEKIKNL